MRIRASLVAIVRPHPGRRGGGGQPRPVRVWPDDATLWLDENGTRRPRAARHALAALAAVGRGGPYAARVEGTGKLLTGPASALALRDARAESGFVFCLTPYGYGEEPF